MNRLLFGDNLRWLRKRDIFPDASVDLVYLDPPFNFYPVYGTNANCNVLFKGAEQLGKLRDERTKCEPQAVASGRERSQPSGESSQAQFHAFTDTWEWTADVDPALCRERAGLKKFLKTLPMTAYLAMVASISL